MKNYDQFHDGWLDGLLIDQKSVQVFLSTEERQPFLVVANGVVALAADGFKAGNIVFEVVTRQKEELTLQDITRAYGLAEGATGQDQAQKLLAKALEQNLIVLEINPSYGASCVLLAESVDLLHRRESLDRKFAGAIV
ncbi:hypothetical protein [Acidicapsa ligni]|uniref:hypothetical protein n=1 Tax=Acidicapsa ligni TaxID=542300 RepID=UPI0021E00AF7|nr:hypothetical protein [Acidicapsa ligni]